MTLAMAKYLGLFVAEASDHLAKLGAELVRLEAAGREGGDTGPLVHEIFRHVHSVKGMAASLELDGIATAAHLAEDLAGAIRGGGTPDPASIDELLAAVDGLGAMVERVRAGESPDPDPVLIARLESAARRRREERREDVPPPPAARRLAVEITLATGSPAPALRGFLAVKRLERLGTISSAEPPIQDLRAGLLPDGRLGVALETAEPLAHVQGVLARISDLERVEVRELANGRGVIAPFAPSGGGASRRSRGAIGGDVAGVGMADRARARGEDGRTVRVRVELLDAFLDGVGELILATARLREIGRGLPEVLRPALDEGVDRLHGTVKELHDQVMAVRMTPLAAVTERLPRAARDLARRTGKQVEVEVSGAEIEIDRAILDELSDPLLHVLRNAVDHGIEPPDLRQQAGKPVTGRIVVGARRDRDRVVVEIADDGRGMDAERLRAAAVARGGLDEGAARLLSTREAFFLACLPGVSTAAELTELSGRGVGMDAAKRTVEALGGALDVESAPGAGTRWIFTLPLTVAVQPVLLVSAAGEVLGLPVAKVHRAVQVDLGSLERDRGRPVLLVEERLVPVKPLAGLLGFGAGELRAEAAVVIAEAEGGRVGLAVDALLGQQDAVLKPLVRPFDQVAGLSAVTVLPSGRPVFVLDVQRLRAA